MKTQKSISRIEDYKTQEEKRAELKQQIDEWLKEGNQITKLKSKTNTILTYRAKAKS